jgi:hypothetical protein
MVSAMETAQKPYHVTILEMQGYGEDFESLDAALLYAASEATAIEEDDGRRMGCDGIICEREDTAEEWVLIEENGCYLWEVQ